MFLFKHLFSKPHATSLIITSGNGFHLRPVAQFSSLGKSFSCKITASFRGKTVDVKSVNTLLSLSLEKGDTFTLCTKGKDADKALQYLQVLFETLMSTDVQVQSIKKETFAYEGEVIEGDIIFQGIAIAPAYHYTSKEIKNSTNTSFQEALNLSLDELETLYQVHKKEENANIYLAQKELLASLGERCETLLDFEEKIKKECHTLLGTKLDSKRVDYQDILQRVKKHLGIERQVDFPDKDFILLGNDLLPSGIHALSKTKVQAVVLQETSIHSHMAILLRAEGITSLIAKTKQLCQNDIFILDAHAGMLIINPSQNDLKKAAQRLLKDKKEQAQSATKRFEPAISTQGISIKVLANVADLVSAQVAKEEGALGIGLLRSEFLFKEEKPSLKTQEKAYKEIFALFNDITVRTLDIGGDKALPYIKIPKENNPFLGIRGVRLFKSHPELLEEQILAIFRASKDKQVKIMFPMVSNVEEFIEAKSFAKAIAKKHHINISNIAFGIMIEVPSVLFLLEAFNEVVDFYSIGTNDLSQYLFAIERTHPTLKIDTLSPVLFSAIETIVTKATKPVSICGELATNTTAIPKLIDMGIETLSVSAKSIAQTKESIRNS